MPRSLPLLALLLLAPPAHAGTASVADGRIRFESAPGERNIVRPVTIPGGLDVYDRGAPLVAGEGCEQVSQRRATCRGGGLIVLCGDGTDRVEGPNRETFVAPDCERVRFFSSAGRNVRDSLTIRSQPVRVTAEGAVFRVRCPLYSSDDFGEHSPCSGRLALWASGERVGVARFSLGGGGTRLVTVALPTPPDDAVVAAIDIAGDRSAGVPAVHGRWLLVLPS